MVPSIRCCAFPSPYPPVRSIGRPSRSSSYDWGVLSFGSVLRTTALKRTPALKGWPPKSKFLAPSNKSDNARRRNVTGVTERNLHLTRARRRALTILIDAPEGCTVEGMIAHGFAVEFLAELLRDGLVNDTFDLVPIGEEKMQVVRLKITDKGRLAINF